MKSYVATPTIDYPKDKVVLFLSDVFGIPLINNKVRRIHLCLFTSTTPNPNHDSRSFSLMTLHGTDTARSCLISSRVRRSLKTS